MTSDSAFSIGKRHHVCQDYAAAGVTGSAVAPDRQDAAPTGPYAIVSDGCSSSSDTDLGARLLVKSTERLIHQHAEITDQDIRQVYERAAAMALVHTRRLGVCAQAVDATLLSVQVHRDTFIAACYGDGVIALERRNGQLDVYSVSYAGGYPRYPAYAHQPARCRAFDAQKENLKSVHHFRRSAGSESLALQDRYLSDAHLEVFTGRVDDYRLAAVLTDGIHSFSRVENARTTKKTASLGMATAIDSLLDFKSTNGAFVQRRLKRVLNVFQEEGWQPLDDLAIGVVRMG